MDVEMNTITAAEERRKEVNGERGVKSDEEATRDYSDLRHPTENIYSESASMRTPLIYPKDIDRRVRLYRGLTIALLILSLILLIVVGVVGKKLSSQPACSQARSAAVSEVCSPEACLTMYPPEKSAKVSSRQACPESVSPVPETCSLEMCKAMYTPVKSCKGCCSQCDKGWLRHGDSCYYLSKRTLSWDKSREECQRKGGDLVVIGNQTVQIFLSSRAKLTHWIGLSHVGSDPWTWINGTPLSESFWAPGSMQGGGCALLEGSQSDQNWRASYCASNTYFICQKDL